MSDKLNINEIEILKHLLNHNDLSFDCFYSHFKKTYQKHIFKLRINELISKNLIYQHFISFEDNFGITRKDYIDKYSLTNQGVIFIQNYISNENFENKQYYKDLFLKFCSSILSSIIVSFLIALLTSYCYNRSIK